MYIDVFFIQKILLNSLNFTDLQTVQIKAVIYTQLITNIEITVKLLILKTLVAHAKPLTIPQLELLSCLLLSKLIKTI